MTCLEIEIKPLQPKHLNQVVELDRLCLGGIWSLAGYQQELSSPNSTLLVLSVVSQLKAGAIVGLACLWAILEEAHITLLAVHPDYQRQGLGQLLLCALLEDAMKRGLERATLEVRETNEAALSLYKKFGFKMAGRRKGYYQNLGEDAIVLWQPRLGTPEFRGDVALWKQQVEERLVENHWLIKV